MQLNQAEFSTLMAGLPEIGQRFVVAVSGGADSLALCFLLNDWAKEHNRTVIALSVDHGLRAESRDECLWVKETLTSFGIEHHILTWTGDKPGASIQHEARKARYKLLEEWCRQNGILDVLLAHHLDDQAETFLMRLARGSGVDGLSAMQIVRTTGKVRLLRPLLSVPKSRLTEYLKNRKQNWIEDPSNQNDDYDRVKFRNAMEMLEDLGLGAQKLAQTAINMQRVRTCLEAATRNWLEKHAVLGNEGYVLLKDAALKDGEEEIILRGLSRIGQVVGAEIYPPRMERLLRLLENLKSFKDSTLMGCRWIIQKGNILICREIRQETIPESLYLIDKKEFLSDMQYRVLGQNGWAQILAADVEVKKTALPKPVIYSLPSFWDKEGVSVVPHLGYKRPNVSCEINLRFNPQIGLFS